MNFGIYYHTPYFQDENGAIFTAGYFGVFLDELAAQNTTLFVILHSRKVRTVNEDYQLKASNIKVINLGYHPSFYKRVLFPSPYILHIKQEVLRHKIEHILVRAPSPLAPHIVNQLGTICKVTYLLVGSYIQGISSLQQPWYRKYPVILINYYYQFLQNKSIKGKSILVNSGELFDYYKGIAAKVNLVKTTTLVSGDFSRRLDTCLNPVYQLLYTGRISFAKGLLEIIQSIETLIYTHQINLHFNIVGWEDDASNPVQQAIIKMAKERKVEHAITFHGRKKIGPELLSMYRKADIYIIPSHHEGFPRTIWEAMASSLPVIATSVGSIPYYLKNETNALLITPKSAQAIESAILTIIKDGDLRRKLIANGYTLAEDVTLDKQVSKLIDNIKNEHSGN